MEAASQRRSSTRAATAGTAARSVQLHHHADRRTTRNPYGGSLRVIASATSGGSVGPAQVHPHQLLQRLEFASANDPAPNHDSKRSQKHVRAPVAEDQSTPINIQNQYEPSAIAVTTSTATPWHAAHCLSSGCVGAAQYGHRVLVVKLVHRAPPHPGREAIQASACGSVLGKGETACGSQPGAPAPARLAATWLPPG